MTYRIRPSEISDTEVLARVHAQAWQETYPGLIPADVLAERSSVEACVSARRDIFASSTSLSGHFLIETDTKRVIGFGDCGPSQEVKQFAPAEVITLYLLKEAQGKGMGKKLLFTMFDNLVTKSFTAAALKTNAKSRTSNGFYQHCGGQIVGQIDRKDWSNIVYIWTNLEHYQL